MKKLLQKAGIVSAFSLAPLAAFASTFGGNGLQGTLDNVQRLVTTATPIVTGLAIVAFFWGLAIFLFNAGNEKKKREGRGIMIYGVVALFIMFSIFGIIQVLQDTLNVQGGRNIDVGSVTSPNVNF